MRDGERRIEFRKVSRTRVYALYKETTSLSRVHEIFPRSSRASCIHIYLAGLVYRREGARDTRANVIGAWQNWTSLNTKRDVWTTRAEFEDEEESTARTVHVQREQRCHGLLPLPAEIVTREILTRRPATAAAAVAAAGASLKTPRYKVGDVLHARGNVFPWIFRRRRTKRLGN